MQKSVPQSKGQTDRVYKFSSYKILPIKVTPFLSPDCSIQRTIALAVCAKIMTYSPKLPLRAIMSV